MACAEKPSRDKSPDFVPPEYRNSAADSAAGGSRKYPHSGWSHNWNDSWPQQVNHANDWKPEQRRAWKAQQEFWNKHYRWPNADEIATWQLHGEWPALGGQPSLLQDVASRPRSEAAESGVPAKSASTVAAQSEEQSSEVVPPVATDSTQSSWQPPRQTAWRGWRAQPQERDPAYCMAMFAALALGFCCGKF